MNIKEQIANYVGDIQKAYHDSPFWGGKDGKNAEHHKFTVEYGRKFAKIIHNSWGQNGVHCFVELANGNIWKAGTWKAPQPNGVRGNLNNFTKPLFSEDFYVRA